jgi:lipoprotein-anchoring transpeptidase ErfK/SrfK
MKRNIASSKRRRLTALAVALFGLLTLAPAAPAAGPPPPFPAAGELLRSKVAARARPTGTARIVYTFRQFRSDYRPTIVHAIAQRKYETGDPYAEPVVWYKVRLPVRPYGRTGWVRADGVEVFSIAERVVVDRSARTLSVYRGARRIFRTRVAVGRPDRPTPLGRFYVAAKYVPQRTTLVSTYALELSAPAGLSDFPGGGVVGIHGTPATWSIGKAASNGCVRVYPRAALALRRIVPLGAPVAVVR